MQMLACCMGVAVVVVQQEGLNQAAHLLSCTAQVCPLFNLPAQQQLSPVDTKCCAFSIAIARWALAPHMTAWCLSSHGRFAGAVH